VAKAIATVGGIALRPGISLNRRLYTPKMIADAVAEAQAKIAAGESMEIVHRDGGQPDGLAQLTHHSADDDSTRIVGRLTGMSLDEHGNARFTAAIADTPHGRTVASLLDTSDGQPPFLKGVSIRGYWKGTVRKIRTETGENAETASGITLAGLDYTKTPGVAGAQVDSFAWTRGGTRSETTERVLITESVQEARVTITEEVAPAGDAEPQATAAESLEALRGTFGLVEHILEDGLCVTCAPVAEGGDAPGDGTKPYGNVTYADPGYQADKKKRYPLDSKAHAKSAWSFISQAKNASAYSANQLKRVKGRIMAALKKFGVKVSSSEAWASGKLALTEHFGDEGGSFSVSLNNGALCVTVSSYCVDPCDLDVIGTAAMNAACLALGAMDPDMDGDIDVPGADAEDDDGDNGDPMTYKPPMDRETAPDDAATTQDPAPDLAAVPHTETEVPAMADTANPAVEATPAAAATEAAPAAPVTYALTQEQFDALLAARAAVAPAPVATEAAPAPVAAEVTETKEQRMERLGALAAEKVAEAAAAAGLTETDEQIIARLIEAQMTPLRQAAAERGIGVQRQGFTTGRVNENVAPGASGGMPALNSHGMPAGAPDKPLDKYTDEELAVHGHPLLVGHAFGDRAYKLG
jgi:hypothetical protein